MDPSVLARFATSCGAFTPLAIAIEYHDGIVATTGTLAQPFAIIGRDPTCDIALDSPDLLPHTAFLQVIGGQVFVGDLGTPAGLRWHHGRHPFGWMHPLEPIRIGPFALRLLQPVSPHPAPFGPTFHPLMPGPDMPVGLPPVEIAFRTGQADRDCWPVNRVLTTIGSAPDCKIHLGGDDVARHHCYLLHTPDGLWAVDLTCQTGIRVNDHPVRCARLCEGDELQIGRFVMGISYPFPSEDDGLISFDEVPRPIPQSLENESLTQSAHRPLERIATVRRPPRTEFDVEVPPPTLSEPAPADWSVEDDTDQIHRQGPRPLSAAEFALLLPVDERGVADSGGVPELTDDPLAR